MKAYLDKQAPPMPEPDWSLEARHRVNAAIDCLNRDMVAETDLLRLETALRAAMTAHSAAKAKKILRRPF